MSALPILAFFFGHWFLAAFCQSFFLHRYCSHTQFTMSRFWERSFHLLTLFAQGSSYLNPRAYAVLHREHHAHSDTEEDPHSPHFFREVFSMMWHTRRVYFDLKDGRREVPAGLAGKLPRWDALEAIGGSWIFSIACMAGYTAFYVAFAPSAWWYLLLPVHFLMGPVHGAFVNWCGHKYGYRNFHLDDHSHNTFPVDIFFMGECFQNNHHRYPNRANFAVKKFEFDVLHPVILGLDRMGVIRLKLESKA